MLFGNVCFKFYPLKQLFKQTAKRTNFYLLKRLRNDQITSIVKSRRTKITQHRMALSTN